MSTFVSYLTQGVSPRNGHTQHWAVCRARDGEPHHFWESRIRATPARAQDDLNRHIQREHAPHPKETP